MPTGSGRSQDVSVLMSADPANLRTMPPRDADAHLELFALSSSDAVEDGTHTCTGSIFGKVDRDALDETGMVPPS